MSCSSWAMPASCPFPDASFDRVMATQVLLDLDDPWPAVA